MPSVILWFPGSDQLARRLRLLSEIHLTTIFILGLMALNQISANSNPLLKKWFTALRGVISV
jgi:hypothetical protein